MAGQGRRASHVLRRPRALALLSLLLFVPLTAAAALTDAVGAELTAIMADIAALPARDAGAALEALQAAVLLEAEAPTTLTAPLPLSCACKPRACTCDKTCYCHIRPSTYAGDRLAPPAVDGGGLPAHAPLHNCACNVGSVGGYSFEAGNSVDCDCAQAQCTCTQACDCPQAPT